MLMMLDECASSTRANLAQPFPTSALKLTRQQCFSNIAAACCSLLQRATTANDNCFAQWIDHSEWGVRIANSLKETWMKCEPEIQRKELLLIAIEEATRIATVKKV